jgi:hypothetical protein
MPALSVAGVQDGWDGASARGRCAIVAGVAGGDRVRVASWNNTLLRSVLHAYKIVTGGGDVLRLVLVVTLISFILAACGDTHFERGATGAGTGGEFLDEDFWVH